MLQSSVKLSTCDQRNPSVVKPSSTIGWQARSSEIGYRLVSEIVSYMGFFSYFGQRVSFLLAPRARKKWALSVTAFTVLLSVSLETYISFEAGHLYAYVTCETCKAEKYILFRMCSYSHTGIAHCGYLTLCQSKKTKENINTCSIVFGFTFWSFLHLYLYLTIRCTLVSF